MAAREPAVAMRWEASLALGYLRRGGRTVLARRSHSGPLRVQRDLYPEGEGTCHTIVVHPPGGIAGGDALAVDATLGPECAALLTTPGAGKWYRSDEEPASQSLSFDLGSGAMLEWLPRETIVFSGARAEMETQVTLQEGAVYLGWEILCLGRAAAGERLVRGRVRQRTEIRQHGRPLWVERARFEGGDPLLDSPVGLAGRTVSATLVAAGRDLPAELILECKRLQPGESGRAGVTRLPRLAAARYLGDSGEEAHDYFARLWALLRPALKGCTAVKPRIWST